MNSDGTVNTAVTPVKIGSSITLSTRRAKGQIGLAGRRGWQAGRVQSHPPGEGDDRRSPGYLLHERRPWTSRWPDAGQRTNSYRCAARRVCAGSPPGGRCIHDPRRGVDRCVGKLIQRWIYESICRCSHCAPDSHPPLVGRGYPVARASLNIILCSSGGRKSLGSRFSLIQTSLPRITSSGIKRHFPKMPSVLVPRITLANTCRTGGTGYVLRSIYAAAAHWAGSFGKMKSR